MKRDGALVRRATDEQIDDPSFIPFEPDPDLVSSPNKRITRRYREIALAAREEAQRVRAERERRGVVSRRPS